MPGTSNAQGDDDVIMTQCDVKTACPITRCEMTDPVTNKHCQHNYERAAIMQIVKNRKNAKYAQKSCVVVLSLILNLESAVQLPSIVHITPDSKSILNAHTE